MQEKERNGRVTVIKIVEAPGDLLNMLRIFPQNILHFILLQSLPQFTLSFHPFYGGWVGGDMLYVDRLGLSEGFWVRERDFWGGRGGWKRQKLLVLSACFQSLNFYCQFILITSIIARWLPLLCLFFSSFCSLFTFPVLSHYLHRVTRHFIIKLQFKNTIF